jgi:hypothetical protein
MTTKPIAVSVVTQPVSNAPTGFTVHVRDVRAYTGADWLVPLCGEIMTMPGLGRKAAAFDVDIDEQGRTVGPSRAGTQVQQVSQQPSPRHDSRPSLKATPAITSAAPGSAHHHPISAFAPSPTRSATDRYAQIMFC